MVEDADNMPRTDSFKTSFPQTLGGKALVIAFALFMLGCAQWTFAQQSHPKTFASPAQASQALYEAVQKRDEQAVQAILGAGPQLTTSGSQAEDKLDRERFVQKYEQMHRLVHEPDGFMILYIGAENWPFPIPLTRENGRWHFDSSTGAQEILARRVGENETTAIQVCQQVLAATRNEAKPTSDDPITDYAQHIIAGGFANGRPLQEDGLFRGYYYRVVPETSGGAVLVAYPSKYGVTGVMTFVMSGRSVYEKDLGPKTATLARQIQAKLTGGWKVVQ